MARVLSTFPSSRLQDSEARPASTRPSSLQSSLGCRDSDSRWPECCPHHPQALFKGRVCEDGTIPPPQGPDLRTSALEECRRGALGSHLPLPTSQGSSSVPFKA